MEQLNIEIKARSGSQDQMRKVLKSKRAEFRGIDHQVDTYFKVHSGILKLREGIIENYLIFYNRERQEGPKASRVVLFENEPESSLKEILLKSLGLLAVVDKQREIYFIDNVKFHIDSVRNLGTFVEIEASPKTLQSFRANLLPKPSEALCSTNFRLEAQAIGALFCTPGAK